MEEQMQVEKDDGNENNDQSTNEIAKKVNVSYGRVEIGILICSILIFISVFLKWAYLRDIKITDYLPQFKIIAAINAFAILGMLSIELKAKRAALIGIVINLIIFTIYYIKMNEIWGSGFDASKFITIHFGFWLGFIGSIVAFLLILVKLFTKKN